MLDQENAQLYPRAKRNEISRYLDEVLEQIQPLDRRLDDGSDLSRLPEILRQDLPDSGSWSDREVLIEDIEKAAHKFLDLSQSRRLRVQFGVVDTDTCRLFHVDHVKMRLLCTYKGAGTEWLDDSNVRRAGLGRGDNRRIVRDFSLVKRASPFDLLVLKGQRLFAKKGGAVHRSPPIQSIEEKRVVLKIDES